jgi:hypothetical protein
MSKCTYNYNGVEYSELEFKKILKDLELPLSELSQEDLNLFKEHVMFIHDIQNYRLLNRYTVIHNNGYYDTAIRKVLIPVDSINKENILANIIKFKGLNPLFNLYHLFNEHTIKLIDSTPEIDSKDRLYEYRLAMLLQNNVENTWLNKLLLDLQIGINNTLNTNYDLEVIKNFLSHNINIVESQTVLPDTTESIDVESLLNQLGLNGKVESEQEPNTEIVNYVTEIRELANTDLSNFQKQNQNKVNELIRLYRIENVNIPYDESREGIVSKREIIGQFFTDSINTVANYLKKNQKEDGINLVYVDIPKSDLEKYHVSNNEFSKTMDVESDNWIIPQNITRNYVDLSSVTKITGNFLTLNKAKKELTEIINNLPEPKLNNNFIGNFSAEERGTDINNLFSIENIGFIKPLYNNIIAQEILDTFPYVYQLGSSTLNLPRKYNDLDFISINNDKEIMTWIKDKNIKYQITDGTIEFNYKNELISISLETATKKFLKKIQVNDLETYLESDKRLAALTIKYKQILDRPKDRIDLINIKNLITNLLSEKDSRNKTMRNQAVGFIGELNPNKEDRFDSSTYGSFKHFNNNPIEEKRYLENVPEDTSNGNKIMLGSDSENDLLQKTKDKILELHNRGFEFLVENDKFINYLKSIGANFTLFNEYGNNQLLYQRVGLTETQRQNIQGLKQLEPAYAVASDEKVQEFIDTIYPEIETQFNKEQITNLNSPETVNKFNEFIGRIDYQLVNQEGIIATEKTIRDLAARISDRIGIPYKIISDRTQEFKGKLENGVAVINLAYATLDTPIHEILGHPIIRAIKNRKTYYKTGETAEFHGYGEPYRVTIEKIYDDTLEADIIDNKGNKQKVDLFELSKTQNTLLYQSLLKELETGRGREVFEQVKRDYVTKEKPKSKNYNLIDSKNNSEIEIIQNFGNYWFKEYNETLTRGKQFETNEELEQLISKEQNKHILGKYTLEEQQEEAIVELMSLMTAEKLDNVKDGKLISLLKRLLKEMKQFVRSLINQKELNINSIEADNVKFLIENKLKELIKNGTIKKEC